MFGEVVDARKAVAPNGCVRAMALHGDDPLGRVAEDRHPNQCLELGALVRRPRLTSSGAVGGQSKLVQRGHLQAIVEVFGPQDLRALAAEPVDGGATVAEERAEGPASRANLTVSPAGARDPNGFAEAQ